MTVQKYVRIINIYLDLKFLPLLLFLLLYPASYLKDQVSCMLLTEIFSSLSLSLNFCFHIDFKRHLRWLQVCHKQKYSRPVELFVSNYAIKKMEWITCTESLGSEPPRNKWRQPQKTKAWGGQPSNATFRKGTSPILFLQRKSKNQTELFLSFKN